MKYEKVYEELQRIEVQTAIREENRNKAGIYMIENKENGERYIGSAGTDRINVKFRNHVIHRTGAKKTAEAVAKYGIEKMRFYVIEYYPGLVKKENLSAAHMGLIEREMKYIREQSPEYNNNKESPEKSPEKSLEKSPENNNNKESPEKSLEKKEETQEGKRGKKEKGE